MTKAYTTRVGNGPFPTELLGEEGERLRTLGREFGATTGRPRRCGWFDAAILRVSTRINGLTSIALTRLDVLDQCEQLKLGVGYRCGDQVLEEFPADPQVLDQCEPIYQEMAGWCAPTTAARSFDRSAPPSAGLRGASRRTEPSAGLPDFRRTGARSHHPPSPEPCYSTLHPLSPSRTSCAV